MSDNREPLAIHERAPAKINLFLHVGRRGEDGRHALESLVVFTAFGDEVEITSSANLSLERTGPFADGLPPNPEDDLCLRAARQLADAFGVTPTARIRLKKNIPVAAGVGGGSSDAAAVLRGLCRLWQLDAGDPRVIRIAESLGADVPVCLRGGAAFVSGIGEIVDPLSSDPVLHLLLVNPNEALSTADVFGAFANARGVATEHFESMRFDDGEALIDKIATSRNDLFGAARELCPSVKLILRALEQCPDCVVARMSGSGATCFGVFPDAESCQRAGAAVSQAFGHWWVCPTKTVPLI